MNFLIIIFFSGIALISWMKWVETGFFELTRRETKIKKKLPGPLRILHLSDTHFSGPQKPLAAFFDRLSKETIDLVVITGDIMDCDTGIDECVKNLSKLSPKHGVYAVFGNHDYYDYRKWDSIIHNFPGQSFPVRFNNVGLYVEELEKIGVRLMRNETVPLKIEGDLFLIHGLDDPTTGHANIRETMKNFDRGKVNILLTHTIDVFLDIGEGEIDLAFSGHSHGGQICFPLIGPVITHTRLGRKFASGFHVIQGAKCSISRGLNANRYFRMRLLCRPEAILLSVTGS